ncbi:MAG TPA: cation:proton antiporter [bacterium]|nr:cation:proton antiporter [bacterium]
MHYHDESHIFLFLVQLFILMGCARGLGELFRRWKQPTLTAEILVGVVLGPTILGQFWPGLHGALFPADPIQNNMLETVSQLGVLFLLLDTGIEIDFSIAWRQRGSALRIAFGHIVFPVAIALAVVAILPVKYMGNPDQRILYSIFMATVMNISALSVIAKMLQDLRLLKTDLGFLIISALTVNEVFGWVIHTIVLGIASQETFLMQKAVWVFVITVCLAVLILTVGRRISTNLFEAVHWSRLPEPSTSFTITVLLALLLGAIAQKLGIHSLYGYFLAGVLVGEAKSLSEQTRGMISQMVHSLFAPLFFATIGLKIDFFANFDLRLIVLICSATIAVRYIGTWLGVTRSRVPRVNRDLIAIAHISGGMMEIVVAMLALEAGLITPPVMVAILFSAMLTSSLVGPLMANSLSRRAAVSPAHFLAQDAVIATLKAKSRADAIAQLVAVLDRQPQAAGLASIVDGVMEREDELGTAIGKGVAIPHLRLDGLTDPLLAFGRSPAGIEWDAPDGDPVHSIFLLATPTTTADLHVQILASIARTMENDENRRLIGEAPNSAALFQILTGLLTFGKSKRTRRNKSGRQRRTSEK